MSDYSSSGSGSDTDSDYDAQTEGHVGSVGSGTQVESGTGNTSSLNETQGNDLPLPKVLAQFAKGTINPRKPLLIYATKVVSSTIRKPGRKRGGSRNWTCNICGHPWVGSYSRVKQHLLGIGGKGVTVCEELSMVQRSELLRIQVAADAKGTFSSQNVMSETYQNVEAATSSKRKSKGKKSSMGLMPPPSPGDSGISSSKHKGSRSCALGPTIAGMYSKLNRDDTDDAIGKFLFANGIPFHVSRSPYYKEMVKAIATAGSSYVPPGEHKLRTVILNKQVSNITMHKEQMRQTWVREIVMDLGRRPLARFPSGDWIISDDPVTFHDLEYAISLVGDFGDDNRAGIDCSLHRISAIRNRTGRIIGLTCRVGRAIPGTAGLVRDLVEDGGSILIIGPPGVGKTTLIREIARVTADDYKKRTVVVDTSNEIAGDGDIPHACIGRARRMQVPNVDMQHKVMIEAVENHMPQTIIIDEIGTELEAMAASTISQRGIQLVGTAHGMTIENLIKNPSLEMLIGGVQSVTLGDDEAKRRGVQKTILERKGPSSFTYAVEMTSRTECRVHHSLEATVDAILAGKSPLFEVRQMVMKVVTDGSPVTTELGIGSHSMSTLTCLESDGVFEAGNESDDDDLFGLKGSGEKFRKDNDSPLILYTYQIMEADLEQVVEVMGLENAVKFTNDIGAADAILALHSKLKQNSWIRGVAKYQRLPIFVMKTNMMAEMVRAMRIILGLETLGASSLCSFKKFKNDIEISDGAAKRRTSREEIDALEEARLAIEYIVIPGGQPVELLPRCADIIARQIKLVESYQLVTEKSGTELDSRLQILPLLADKKETYYQI